MIVKTELVEELNAANSLCELKVCHQHFYQWIAHEFSQQPVRTLIQARAEFIDLLLNKLFT